MKFAISLFLILFSLTANAVTLTNLSVPMLSWLNQTNATNSATQLARDLSALSTFSLNQNSNLVSELVGKTNAQTIAGNKTFTGTNVFTNSANVFYGMLTGNVQATSGSISNTVFRGTIIGTNDFKINSYDTPNNVFDVFDFNISDSVGSANSVIRLFNFNTDQFDLRDDLVGVSDGASAVNIKSGALFDSIDMSGSNRISGYIHFSKYNLTTLANGNNSALNPTDKTYISLSGNTATANIAGIAGGFDGRELILENATAYNIVLLSESGLDAAATNRFRSAEFTILPYDAKRIIYNSSAQRWTIQR